MIKARHRPPGFTQDFLSDQIDRLWPPWMGEADQVLEDEQLVALVYEALAQRHPQSRTRGRPGTPAEVVLRMLVLKHMRDWSFQILEWEVRANLVYRRFTRVGAGKVPDAKALGRQAQALGPQVIQKIHARMVDIARENKIATGRRLRVDTTVVENQHSPPDR